MKNNKNDVAYKQNVNLLAINGGGFRGIISLGILNAIEQYMQNEFKNNPHLLQQFNLNNPEDFRLAFVFDLIGGTSAGAIIAAYMVLAKEIIDPNTGEIIYDKSDTQFSLNEGFDVYASIATAVATPSKWHQLETLWGLIGPEYDNQNLEQALLSYFKDATMQDVVTKLLINTYDYTHDVPITWVSGKTNVPLYQLNTAAGCAIPYIGPYTIEDNLFIDAGYYSNTAALEVLALALKYDIIKPGVTKNINFITIGAGEWFLTKSEFENYGLTGVLPHVSELFSLPSSQQALILTQEFGEATAKNLNIQFEFFPFRPNVSDYDTFPPAEEWSELEQCAIEYMSTDGQHVMQQFVQDVLYAHPYTI